MTYNAALAASVARSLLLTVAGLSLAHVLAAWIRDAPRNSVARFRTILVLLPFLTPNLVVGFAYRGLSLNLLRFPFWNELLYFLIVLFEVAPAAVWLILHRPAPRVSAEAVHVARLAAANEASRWRSWQERFRLWGRGPASTSFAPAALLFLLSFQEAELAALMQVWSWPERVFTDATRGLPPEATLRLVAWPVLIQLVVMAPVVRVLADWRTAVVSPRHGASPLARWLGPARLHGIAGAAMAVGLLLVVGFPAVHLIRSVKTAGRALQLQPMWFREVGDALILAVTCGGLTWLLALAWQWSMNRRSGRGDSGPASVCRPSFLRQGVVWWATLTPGLMGTLAIGLVTAAAFQRFLPSLAYTPLPLVLAELVWLWPRAVLVHQALESRTRMPARQVELLAASPVENQRRGASSLWWILRGQVLLGGLLLVSWWSYMELMLPTLLAIPGFQPAPMLLYNHLHYGQIVALGVKLVLILGAPAFLLAGGWFLMTRLRFDRVR